MCLIQRNDDDDKADQIEWLKCILKLGDCFWLRLLPVMRLQLCPNPKPDDLYYLYDLFLIFSIMALFFSKGTLRKK